MLNALLSLLLAAPTAPCGEARALYESLSLEAAVEAATAGLRRGPDRPLACLEVRGLGLLVLGRLEEARPAFAELFARDPAYPIQDPSLSPSMLGVIVGIREEARPLVASARARWLVRESLRLDVQLEGGLRRADRVRYATETAPDAQRGSGVMPLVGRAATATVAVPPEATIDSLRFSGEVLDVDGKTLASFDDRLILGLRPEAVEAPSSPVPWPVFAGAGVVAVAATVVIIVLSQPRLPDAKGTLGRVPL